MNWKQTGSMMWDWGNLAQVCPDTTESSMSGSLLKPSDAGAGHGSVTHYDGTFTSRSELGYGSSKSSISASTGSTFKEGVAIEFSFTAVSGEAGRVEDSGTSEPSMAVCHREQLINLKLGKRTYFENVCEEEDAKNCSTGCTTSASTVVKKTKVSQKSIRNSYCQVEGCNVDLSSAKHYHRKHRVCEAHCKAPMVVVAGLERRFCQQCSRFHGLGEFDQNKRSCRRRLSRHNARRRKPQTDATSFAASRLSAMLYNNPRQQANLFFNQLPFSQVRSNAVSAWDNLEGFRFTKTRFPLAKPTEMVGFDETHSSTSKLSNNAVSHAVYHENLDGLMSVKGTKIKVFNQGVQAPATTSNSNGAPVTRRALSLLSDDPWASGPAVNQQFSSHVHSGAMPPLLASNPVLHELDSTSGGFWQDPPSLD